MTDWHALLTAWDDEKRQILSLLASDRAELPFFRNMRTTKVFREAASPKKIEEAELRLGIKLPQDLRAFYAVSNGCAFDGMGDLMLMPIEAIGKIPAEPADYVGNIDEYFSSASEEFLSSENRNGALLLSNMAQIGFCVAAPSTAIDWEYACVEFVARSDKYVGFDNFMMGMKWYCLHYLRGHLDE